MLRSITNIVVLVAVLVVNGMAGSGALSGESIGLIANRYTSFFLPANYVFGIWSLIYLTLTAFAVYQVLPAKRQAPVMDRVGWLWLANGILNMAWVVLFSFSQFLLALVVMVALLGNLIALHVRIADTPPPVSPWDRLLVEGTFDLYLAWISVALIANTFQFMTYVAWGGWGISGEVWSVIMMAVAAGLGGFMALHRRSWIFPLVVAWALWGIGDRFSDIPLLAQGAILLVAACVVFSAAGLWMRLRPAPAAAA